MRWDIFRIHLKNAIGKIRRLLVTQPWSGYGNPKLSRWEIFKSYIGWEDGIALFAIIIGVLGYLHGPIPFIPGLTDFFFDQRSNLIALGLTVLIIDNVNEMYRRRSERERLKLQMGSPDHAFAIEAVRQLRARRWLFDGSLRMADMHGADLHDADLMWADLSQVDLKSANMSGVALHRANLSGADLEGANLQFAAMHHADLSNATVRADLKHASLQEANLSRAHMTDVNLIGLNLMGATLVKTHLNGADLSGAAFCLANMREINLGRAKLVGADLSQTDLRGAYLEDADLRKANLCLADLSDAHLTKALLTEARYDNNTIWPDSFDPVAAGCVDIQDVDVQD